VSKQLSLKNTPIDPLSEEQIVEAAIAFANGATISLLDQVARPTALEAELRQELIRGHLGEIISGNVDEEDLSTGLDDDGFFKTISPRLYLRKTKKGFTVAFYYTFADWFSVVKLGSFFLHDSERPFRERLCRCQLASCGRFFFKIQHATGAPQRKYCCSEHMLKGHDLSAASRMKKRRRATARKK
jgi:hypothetical protein